MDFPVIVTDWQSFSDEGIPPFSGSGVPNQEAIGGSGLKTEICPGGFGGLGVFQKLGGFEFRVFREGEPGGQGCQGGEDGWTFHLTSSVRHPWTGTQR